MYLTTEELIALHMALINDARIHAQEIIDNDPINIIINFFKKLFGRR